MQCSGSPVRRRLQQCCRNVQFGISVQRQQYLPVYPRITPSIQLRDYHARGPGCCICLQRYCMANDRLHIYHDRKCWIQKYKPQRQRRVQSKLSRVCQRRVFDRGQQPGGCLHTMQHSGPAGRQRVQ